MSGRYGGSWAGGGAIPIAVSPVPGTTKTVARGRMLLVGGTLHNDLGVDLHVGLFDAGQLLARVLMPADAAVPVPVPDRGVLVRTELDLAIEAAQPTLTPANPAAGAGFTQTLTRSGTLEAITFTLQTSAVVANRTVFVQYLDAAGNLLVSIPVTGTVVASSIVNVVAAIGITQALNAAGNSRGVLPFPLVLPAGGQVKILVTGEDAGDQLSAIVLGLDNQRTTSAGTIEAVVHVCYLDEYDTDGDPSLHKSSQPAR